MAEFGIVAVLLAFRTSSHIPQAQACSLRRARRYLLTNDPVRKRSDIEVDFTGSSAARNAPINCSRGGLVSAVKTIMRPWWRRALQQRLVSSTQGRGAGRHDLCEAKAVTYWLVL
jgi:hypothetical protein